MSSRINIKNMVCPRCIKVVRDELTKTGFTVSSVSLGEAVVDEELSPEALNKIKEVLEKEGFELLEDKKAKIIERVKIAVISKIHSPEGLPESFKFSSYIADEIGLDYNYISTLFSSTENITLERFIILQKIELTKELLRYGELSLNDISWRLGYNSVQHLSNQFKSVTGFSPTEFKKFKAIKRHPLDDVT
jgi:AraC family transcriptional regulator